MAQKNCINGFELFVKENNPIQWPLVTDGACEVKQRSDRLTAKSKGSNVLNKLVKSQVGGKIDLSSLPTLKSINRNHRLHSALPLEPVIHLTNQLINIFTNQLINNFTSQLINIFTSRVINISTIIVSPLAKS